MEVSQQEEEMAGRTHTNPTVTHSQEVLTTAGENRVPGKLKLGGLCRNSWVGLGAGGLLCILPFQ